MTCLAAIQYMLSRDPGFKMLNHTKAAESIAAFRVLPDPLYANKGWFAESWSDWPFANASANASPGGSINYTGANVVQLFGNTVENARAELRDNGNHIAPFSNVIIDGTIGTRPVRLAGWYGTLIQARLRAQTRTATSTFTLGISRSHLADFAYEDGCERFTGFLLEGATGNWRAVCIRSATPDSTSIPGVKTKDTDLGLDGSAFRTMQLEISSGCTSARFRIGNTPFPASGTDIPLVTTAGPSELLSRQGEQNVGWAVTVRELSSLGTPSAASQLNVGNLKVLGFRPGYVGTVPVYRKN